MYDALEGSDLWMSNDHCATRDSCRNRVDLSGKARRVNCLLNSGSTIDFLIILSNSSLSPS